MFSNNELGEKIKATREQKKISQEELAEMSKCPVELVSKLESGDLIPSLSPLMMIARALGVRLGTFLDDAEATTPVINRKSEIEPTVHFSGEQSSSTNPVLDFYSLARNKSDRHMEPFIIDVHPPTYETAPLSTHEGEEFIYVLSGKLEIFYGKETYILDDGDSIYLDSIIPHNVHSYTGTESKILAVVFAPL